MAYNPAAFQGHHNASGAMPTPVGAAYCVPYVAQFIIDQKVLTLSSGKFTIHDAHGQLLFDVKGKIHPVHTKRILRDASGKTIVLMKKKIVTMHDRWEAYRGDDESDSSLLFSMAKTTVYQFTPSFDVFLPHNQHGAPDFTVRGDFFEHNFAIMYGNVPVAEARKKINAASLMVGKDQYGVTVYPGVDHAFIAAIIVIIDQVKQDDMKGQKGGGGGGLGGGGLGGGGLGGGGLGGGGLGGGGLGGGGLGGGGLFGGGGL